MKARSQMTAREKRIMDDKAERDRNKRRELAKKRSLGINDFGFEDTDKEDMEELSATDFGGANNVEENKEDVEGKTLKKKRGNLKKKAVWFLISSLGVTGVVWVIVITCMVLLVMFGGLIAALVSLGDLK